MCSLYFYDIIHIYPYHTSGKNIQILGYLVFKIFQNCDILYFMTEEYTGTNCCAACTCDSPHRSKPIEEE